MNSPSVTTIEDVKSVLVSTLGIEDRADRLTPSTVLFGGLPELDSMAVVELVVALEQRFAITVEDDDITGDVFETLESLTAFVESRLG